MSSCKMGDWTSLKLSSLVLTTIHGKGNCILNPASSLAIVLLRLTTCLLLSPVRWLGPSSNLHVLGRVELTYHHEARLIIERGPVRVDEGLLQLLEGDIAAVIGIH